MTYYPACLPEQPHTAQWCRIINSTEVELIINRGRLMSNSFDARNTLTVNGKDYEIYQLTRIAGTERLPYSMKILLENLEIRV